jgi:inosine-uridine nucleoside N-ribohydrolase
MDRESWAVSTAVFIHPARREQHMREQSRLRGFMLAMSVALGGGACASGEQATSEVASQASELRFDERQRTPIVFDSDMDFDDTAALAYLCQQHKMGKIELRAVTVTNNGAGLPGEAIRHARCMLAECGLDIPVADGSPVGTNSFSPALRYGVNQILNDTFASCTASTESSTIPASQLLADTIQRSARPVTILATGPLSNVAAALATLASRSASLPFTKVRRAVVMGGAVRVPGNAEPGPTADGSQELNFWADPASAQAVIDRLTPGRLTLIPLDATNHVPVTLAYLSRLDADKSTPETQYVSRLMSHPFIQFAVASGAPLYWWDPVAAIAASSISTEGVVEYEWMRIDVTQTGVQQGRTVERSRRNHWVRVGIAVDRTRFEDVFLDGLNGR